MLDLIKLNKILNNNGNFTKYTNGFVYTNNFVYCDENQGESFCFEFVENQKGIIINDMGLTCNKLLSKGLDINAEQDLIQYRDRVLNTFGVTIDKNNKLFVIAKTMQECPTALGNLTQCMVLLNYIELQFDE